MTSPLTSSNQAPTVNGQGMFVVSLSLLLPLCALSEWSIIERKPGDETCNLELQKQVRMAARNAGRYSYMDVANFTGSCSALDAAAMKKFGGGSTEGTFPKIVADCGHSAFSIWSGFNRNSMAHCVQSETKLTPQCASCFGQSGQYGFDHCKFACLRSWCSKDCLGCSDPNKAALHKCMGFSGPEAEAC